MTFAEKWHTGNLWEDILNVILDDRVEDVLEQDEIETFREFKNNATLQFGQYLVSVPVDNGLMWILFGSDEVVVIQSEDAADYTKPQSLEGIPVWPLFGSQSPS